ncbi:SH3 domain-binding protein 5-like (SH3BP-5-like) [Durusdinium trenchii]|uniref:SH3 domain-binding protein 5-like (SH3BP-5-like) n=1 Tax=Durusdinium trenchii TaxID=1381693 RepID=A0ABP0M5Z6_9DINO
MADAAAPQTTRDGTDDPSRVREKTGREACRPHPLLDYEVSDNAENEAATAMYAAAMGLPSKELNAKSLPSSLNNKLWQTRSFAASMAEVLYEEASPQAGFSPQIYRKGRSFSDEGLDFAPGRSPPLSPSRGDPPAGEEYAALHDARHVGPLDFASSITSADPVVVYVRLSNFVARRRGRLRLHLEEATASDDDLDLEPFSPVLHPHGVLHHPHGSFDAQFVPDSRLRRSRSGSDSNSSAYGSSPNLQVARQISGDSTSFEERKAETPEEPERLTVHPSPNLERCSTWSETRRSDLPEPEEEEEIASIQRHLEAMNAAAADLNAAQESLNACLKRQRSMIHLWAVVNARLARAVGANHIAKAAPLYLCQRRCKAAQTAVQEAGCSMLTASEGDMDDVNKQYAARLQEFQDARKEFAKLSAKNDAPSEAALAAVAPYFEAEEEHRGQLAEEQSQEELLRQTVTQAKTRYHGALRSLETLSNQAHLRRASSGVLEPVSRTATEERQERMMKRSPTCQTPERPPKVLRGDSRRRRTGHGPSLPLQKDLGDEELMESEHELPAS